ncbi:contactin-1a isoform X1 [Colossoma macropomum]|uniref:contactin-1a isoform X1 n=1 Tax=Colossoma macropomum TaxID=42526 RepID=UPI00186531B5|nr:contactin-1a isoform X1 [Colossoma macropomum]XP_036432205.1 contactin-1a isoform X1 [Colossoma macropomum]XP_036432206.1 contactin-1a isoform X1 [Colossoma macropomum]XP_036432207.1 contactin-1a isoform X1 [Colossoma macropomum]XP_036432208.1 contactin-1a isoform X1 [Colossoma macropomum]
MCHLTSLLLALSLTLSSSPAVVYGDPSGIFSDDSTGYGPVFEEQPVNTIYPEEAPEDKIIMSCRARASPPATYKWSLNSWKIDVQDGSDNHYTVVGGNLVISNPDKSKHAGNYSCLATNEFGTVISREASVQFGYLDMFSTEEREAVYVKEGQGVVLLCAPPPHFPNDLSFRWMLNEFPIFIRLDKRRFVSQTTGNLYISKVEASDSGNYSCFVSSPSIAKSVFSKFIPLVPLAERPIRKYPADIKVKFPDTYALVGQNITLECFALGNPIPQIRWRKVDGALPAHHEISTVGGLLHLFNVQFEDEGMYECEVINSKGKDWHKAHLYVEAPPDWVEHISSSEKGIGSDYTLSCLAGGKPKPQIYFLKNGQMYGKHELRFTDMTFYDSGMYQCIAENRHGVIYANAELRVFASSPSFELNPVKQRILGAKNGHVVIECKPRAAPRPTFSWSKGTELLSNSSRIFIWEDGSLEIRNITKSDEGKYTCFAENDRGKANSTGSLLVTDATKITLAPSNADVSVGENTKMQCAASHDSSLDLTFIWTLNDHVIDFDKEEEYYQYVMDGQAGMSSCELLIKNTQMKHAGRYTCMAQTPVDNVTASADLVVRGPPGPSGGVRVEEIGPKSVRLLWSQGSDNLSPISKYTIQYRETRTPEEDWKDAVTSPPNVEGNAETATVVDLIPWTEYEFRVIATNTLGTGEPSDPSPKTRTQDAVPVVAPSDVGGGGGTSRELTITWTPVQPQYYYGSNFGYIIAFKPEDGFQWRKVTVADPEARRYVHKDPSIPPATKFDVKVKAFNSKGEGPYSLTAAIYSAQDVPSEAPTIVEARTLSATEAIVWWQPVLQQTVEGYQVRYWRKSMENEATAQRISNRENQTRLDNMKPDSHYVIEVRAFNGAGYGPPSQRYEIHTKKAPPSRPPNIISTKMNPSGTSVNIAWEQVEPLVNESTVQCYKVLYRQEGRSTGVLYTTDKQYIDLPMRKDGDYLVEVRAHSEGGDGAVAQVRISGGGVLVAQSLSICVLLLVAVLSLAL